MDNVIAITTRDVYGAVKAYPANAQAQGLADIAGTTTLTPSVLSIAREMGFDIQIVQSDATSYDIAVLGLT